MRNDPIFYKALRNVLWLPVKRLPVVKRWNLKRLVKKGTIIPLCDMDNYLNAADKVMIPPLTNKIHVGLVKEQQEIRSEDHLMKRAYWPKYERFLKNNSINYAFYDIQSSTWQDEAARFDVVLWRPHSSPDVQAEAESKIYFLEKYLGKRCYPSFEEIWSYEDKVRASYLYKYFELPAVRTFTTNSKIEARHFADKTSFPIVSKITTGSSSYGTVKLKNKLSALMFINSCFSRSGRKTFWPFIRQKNYVYFQKFINNANYDLRIIVVGNKVFGYYRYPKPGDFRASGSGIIEKKALPEEAMTIAIDAKRKLKSTTLAVDMIYSELEKKHLIIETSIFIGIDTAAQLAIDGQPGYYEYSGNIFTFKNGKFWIQELALQEFFNFLQMP
ncbi:MAG: hypothetical protein ABI416_11010 [Ginsengibacter sp.]